MKTPIQIGTYRLRNGRKACIVQVNAASAVGTIEDTGDTLRWNSETGFFGYLEPGPWDLVERLPDAPRELPPALNAAVKAAEDRVLDLKKHYGAAQDVAEEARRMWEEAKRELERLEKECEVKP